MLTQGQLLRSPRRSRLAAAAAPGGKTHRLPTRVRALADSSGADAELPDPKRSPYYGLLDHTTRIGSEHGEGFIQYRPSGEQFRLDVDALNEQLKHTGAIRLRHAMKPDEAFGMVFNFDGVVADIASLQRQAWQELADRQQLPPAQFDRPEVFRMSPEYLIIQSFQWTNNRKEALRLSWELAAIFSELMASTLTAPKEGVREWLNALTNFNIPCSLVSTLDRSLVRRALERMYLHDHFSTMVTAEDDMETISQRLLSASMKLARPPNLCVFHDNSPEGVTAAHNCSMKAVAVVGKYPAYHLKQADLTCGSLGDLTVYNVRRLFANRGAEFMDLAKQINNDKPGKKRSIMNATL